MRPIAVLGCTSDAGKSLLTAALCRWFVRNGVDVVPYKAQNMSNNARVVDGGEIGVAQWLQAKAARTDPTIAMNPVLLKPEADTRSMVIVDGRPRPDIAATPWSERGALVWPSMQGAFDSLRAVHDLVVIEGAGSPAEINLPDLVNNRIVEHADAVAILVADIDRGGAFAHLVGTHALVPDAVRERLRGFVLNKFRGDASLLAPAPQEIAERTGMAHLATMPMLHHQLPDEEGGSIRATPSGSAPSVAIVRYPFSSNLDEWYLLGHVAHVRWATTPGDLAGSDVVILPGSKHVAADIGWMRARGLDDAVRASAARGTKVVGVCGGCMMLGDAIDDPDGVEGHADGLGLLPFSTTMDPVKITERVTVRFEDADGPWHSLRGLEASGYEIRHGRVGDGRLVWSSGSVLGTTVHGLFESPDVLDAVFGRRPPDVLDATFDMLADAIDEHVDVGALWKMVEPS